MFARRRRSEINKYVEFFDNSAFLSFLLRQITNVEALFSSAVSKKVTHVIVEGRHSISHKTITLNLFSSTFQSVSASGHDEDDATQYSQTGNQWMSVWNTLQSQVRN